MTNPRLLLPARPKSLRFEIPCVADGVFAFDPGVEQATITIFNAIGADVTAASVARALQQIGEKPVTLLVNSPGGDYYEGVAIYNLLRAHSQPVTAQVLGVAASAASLLIMAASRIEIARNAEIMIHDPWTIAVGNADAMAHVEKVLRQLNGICAAVYAERTGQPVDRVAELMSAETFLGSGQALALGFADALLDRDADPKLRTAESAAPQSKRDLEAQLRKLGFAKAAAERLAAGGWPALKRESDEPALQQLAEVLQAQAREIQSIG